MQLIERTDTLETVTIVYDADPDGGLSAFLIYLSLIGEGYHDNEFKLLPVGHGKSFDELDLSTINTGRLYVLDLELTQEKIEQITNSSVNTAFIYDHHPGTERVSSEWKTVNSDISLTKLLTMPRKGHLEIIDDERDVRGIVLKTPLSTNSPLSTAGLVLKSLMETNACYPDSCQNTYLRDGLIESVKWPADVFLSVNVMLARLEELVSIVSNYDCWNNKELSESQFNVCKAYVSWVFEQGREKYTSVDWWKAAYLNFLENLRVAKLAYHHREEACKNVVKKYMLKGIFFAPGEQILKMGIVFHSDNMDLIAEAAFKEDPEIGIVAIVYLKPGNGSNSWKVSLRSKGDIDTTIITSMYGGGGHMNASGMQVGFCEFSEFMENFEQVASFS